MMSDDNGGVSDMESQYEDERELTLTSLSQRDSWSWGKRAAVALAVVALVLLVTIPVALTAGKNNDTAAASSSSSSSAFGVGTDSNNGGGSNPALTTEDPLESVTTFDHKDKEEEDRPTIVAEYPPTTEKAPTQKEPTEAAPTEEEATPLPAVKVEKVCPANATKEESSEWYQIADDIVGESAHDLSASAIAMSADGTIVAIGSNSNDNDNGINAGHVRIYRYQADIGFFTRLGQELDGVAAGDWFGHSVALSASGYRLAAGGVWNDGPHGNNSGHVRVFDYVTEDNEEDSAKDGEWVQVGDDIDGEAEEDRFGTSVSISADGKRLAIGASSCNGSGVNMTDIGCVYIYSLEGGSWTLMEKLQGEFQGDMFGTAVELSDDGQHIVVGAHKHDNPLGGVEAGQVYVYEYVSSEESWFKVGDDIEGIFPGEWAGLAVSINGNGTRVAVGFPGNNMGIPVPGFSRVYELNSGHWTQLGALDLTGGYALSLSRCGKRIAVGDYKGFNAGIVSGHVYVYDWNTENLDWELVGEEINGKDQQMEMLGLSVALSADGERLAVGVPRAATDFNNEIGAARVFDLC